MATYSLSNRKADWQKTTHLRTFRLCHIAVNMKTDPFKDEGLRARLTIVGGLFLMALFLGVAFLLPGGTATFQGERPLDGRVTRVGTYAFETGDLPILTIKLPDGSLRQLQTSWAAAARCSPGSSISLLQKGMRLRVGLTGCGSAR